MVLDTIPYWKQWKMNNPDRVKAIAQRFRDNHREQKRKESHIYYHENIEKIRERYRDHYYRYRTKRLEYNRRAKLKLRYNLTVPEYETIVSTQKGRCKICGAIPKRRLDIDHNHLTGQVRGLLCNRCNHVLGRIKDSTNLLYKMIAYLEETSLWK